MSVAKFLAILLDWVVCVFRARMNRRKKIAKIMRSDGHSRTSISETLRQGQVWECVSCSGETGVMGVQSGPWLHPNCGSFLTVHA